MTKTIDIEKMIEIVNKRNRTSTCPARIRQGWNSLLEAVLHETGNYHGFGYYDEGEVPEGFRPGIRTGGKPHCDMTEEEISNRFRNVDETRVFYYSR